MYSSLKIDNLFYILQTNELHLLNTPNSLLSDGNINIFNYIELDNNSYITIKKDDNISSIKIYIK